MTHVVFGMALFSLLAGSTKPKPRSAPPPLQLEVTLISETPPPVRQPPRAPSPAPRAAEPKGESLPSAPAAGDPRKNQKHPAAPPSPAPSDTEGVYVGPSVLSQSDVPLGLRGALEDPCDPKFNPHRADCSPPDWSARLAQGNLLVTPSLATLKRMYPGFGEGSSRGDALKQRHESEIMGSRGLPNGGVAGLGGINDLVGRLPN